MKKRFIGLDYLKVLSLLMVLSIHVYLYDFDFVSSGNVFNIIQYAFRLISEGVPLFVIINGFLMFRKENIDIKQFYKKTFWYFVYFVFFGALTILLTYENGPISYNAFLEEFLQIASGRTYVGYLWFLQSLIAVYLIFPALHYIYWNNYRIYTGLLKIVTFFSVGLNTVKLIAEIFLRIDADKFSSLVFINNFFNRFDPFSMSSFLLFFLLGGYINRNIEKLSSKLKVLWLLSAISWIISVAYGVTLSRMTINLLQPGFNYGSIFLVLQVITVFVTFMQINEKGTKVEKVFSYISSCSLWIYLTHSIIIYRISQYFIRSNFIERLTFLFVVFFISLIISTVINYFKKFITTKIKSLKQ